MDFNLVEEVVANEQAHLPVTPESPSQKHDAARSSRARRKKRNQQQFKRALKKMMTSFGKMFDDSDADISDSEDSLPARGRLHFEEASSRPQSQDTHPEVIRLRSPGKRDISVNSYEAAPQHPDDANDETGLHHGAFSSRKGAVIEEAEYSAIQYTTKLYQYQRAPEGDVDEANLMDSRASSTPLQVISLKAGPGNYVSGPSNYCFEVVHMYSLPGRNTLTRRKIYQEDQLRPPKVTAGLGSYLVIYSEVIMSAIRSCVKSYPGLSRAFEFMNIPAPYTLLVQYRKELQEYSDNLPSETISSVSEGASPVDDREEEDDYGDYDSRRVNRVPVLPQKKHIPLLLKHVFTDELTSQLEGELSLRTRPVPTCTYALVWLLFRPGTMVYASDGGGLHSAYIVDWYQLEGLYDQTTEIIYEQEGPVPRRRGYSRYRTDGDHPPPGLTDTVKPSPVPRGETPEFSPVPKSIIVKMHYLEFDGEHVGRRPHQVTIEPFDGEKEIVSLPIYPAEFARGPQVGEYLVTRGQKYIKLCQPSYMAYEGDTIATLSTPSRKINARVMIDSRTFYNETNRTLRLKAPTEDGIISDSSSESEASDIELVNVNRNRRGPVYIESSGRNRRIRIPKKAPIRRRGMADYDLVKPSEIEFTDDQFMLFPARLRGFVLRERRWYLLNVDNLKEPVFQENILDDLVLKEEAKNLIQALSNTAMEDTTSEDRSNSFGHWTADIVQNKGEGRIFLLHGKPGVAECVAESARAPLLAITCGDLGTEPDIVETALMKWFKLATLWKAVLLLDEADVYLESRLSGDLTRNSLVSIFLRALEYYQGVLFLTTNRVGAFDEAMLSRIHVVLHYPAFKDSERQKIWMTSFRKLSEERPDVKVGPGLMDYALENKAVLDLQWNGREIRNAFNTIVALAEFDAEKKRRAGRAAAQITLERSHLMQVVTMSKEFKEYMKSTRGMDESGLARAKKVRNDEAMERIAQAATRS